jgi:hypothetical protein
MRGIYPKIVGLCFALTLNIFADQAKPLIAVSTYPLQWVCETLVGDQATVVNLTKDAENPREWVPVDEDLALLEKADVIILQGGGYERWDLKPFTDKSLDSTAEISEKYFEKRQFSKLQEELFYTQINGRAWLDPLHLRLQADYLAKHFSKFLNEEDLKQNQRTLHKALDEMIENFKSNKRLNRERILTLEPTLPKTIGREMGWLMFTPDFQEAPHGALAVLNEENIKKIEQAYVDYPFRMAVTLGEPPPGWENTLQTKWGVWTCKIYPGDRPSAQHASYPDLMIHNFKQLTSGYIQ